MLEIKGLSAQIHQVNTGVLPVQPDAAGFHYWTSIMSSQEISFKNETESSPVLHEESDSTRTAGSGLPASLNSQLKGRKAGN
ncbi:hypothetical protein [Gimesia panareensis]|uniref:hypothetical protein n=1 Tax=Gimesia panareensis TaxID=2527978 RepID=UPI0011AA462A|nr:hypothetical protein [Gimesia panareensis]